MTRHWLVLGLGLALVVPVATPAWAKGHKHDKKSHAQDDEDSDDDSGDDDDEAPKAKAKKADEETDEDSQDDESSDDSSGSDDEGGDEDSESKPREKPDKSSDEPQKQDLTGHDLGTNKKANEFERDRFFVDKTDTKATAHHTLIQGSLTSSSFLYTEGGGQYATPANNAASPGNNNSQYSRYFTDLRLQTDFRHLGGGRWEARVDTRARFVNTPTAPAEPIAGAPSPTIQSGLTGQNEYEIRELWLIRNGERTDVILGRQFIPDLAAVKIDGLRIDYASSSKFTLLGFGGLYPLRGSRSIDTDYIELKNPTNLAQSAGKFVGAGGFGAAYRTPTAYGAFGGVALVPFQIEQPRIFATSNGYYRMGPKLDLYHFALVDLISAYGAQLTNLSAGANYKPAQRLRMTASFNRVDTDSLNIQAAAFFDNKTDNPVVQNEIALQRLATNTARGSISAGLGELQRFEITTAMAYRWRPSFVLAPVGAVMGTELPAAKSVDVYGSITDRHSFKDTRIGVDAVQVFGVGQVAYHRNEVFALRGFVGRELANGHGEWEAEVSYSDTKDVNGTMGCTNLTSCFGESAGTVVSAGGTIYYRYNRDWLMIGQGYLSRTQLTTTGQPADPTITGLTGYFRVAYRF
jgi:hypothetical protein